MKLVKSRAGYQKKKLQFSLKEGWGEESLLEYLTKNINRDIAAKRTMGGPHRSRYLY